MKARLKIPTYVCIVSFLVMLIIVVGGCATTTSTSEEVTKVYKITELGPAGGVVLFDTGDYSDDSRYLEVAPAKTERFLQWGSFQTLADATSQSLGDGKINTSKIIAAHKSVDERDYAARYCDTLIVGSFSDWYLPSKAELDLLYWQLSIQGLGDFKGVGFGYWSSTEYDESQAWGQGFHEGVQGRIDKTEQFLVRAIRSF
jgi:hypothetical protein